MVIEDRERALQLLRQINYYRLSGYWHPMRQFDPQTRQSLDAFQSGATFELTYLLYKFDEHLRHAIAQELAKIELTMRALVGYEMGRVDPLLHLKPDLLGAPARQLPRRPESTKVPAQNRYETWISKYRAALSRSREDFVAHHQSKYGGMLPIWAAVEVMDWGMLSHLYAIAPGRVRGPIADACTLSPPQLESWLKCLNILRNYSAHHARTFNRVFDIKPRLNDDPRLAILRGRENRVFTQLTMIQYLHQALGFGPAIILPSLLATYPANSLVPFARTGAPERWQQTALWTID